MGSVHSVRDVPLLRVSAVKVLQPQLAEDPRAIERFLREAQIMAQLEHPNIVPVHELAMDARGNRYFTMKRVEGRTLTAWIEEVGRPADDAHTLSGMLEVFAKVCDAVSFAHSRGVIHRDIKPDNIMVGMFGQVYLMDWGLALQRSADDPYASQGAPSDGAARSQGGVPLAVSTVAGTPGFMAPEQVRGEPLDERCDVYSLGAVLQNILTGQEPRAVMDGPEPAKARSVPPPARDGGRRTRLLALAERAMAPDPERRYATVADLKHDLEMSLRGLPLPTQRFAAGAPIVTEGEDGDCAYVVIQGTCVAFTSHSGERITLRRMPAGAVFGETAVLSGGRRTASVEAETDVVLSVVSKEVLEQHLGLDTPFGVFIFALADRFRELNERLALQADPPGGRAR
jgi:serine/threonine-protein kinase